MKESESVVGGAKRKRNRKGEVQRVAGKALKEVALILRLKRICGCGEISEGMERAALFFTV